MKVYFYHSSPHMKTASYRLRCYYPSLALKKLSIESTTGNSLTDALEYDVVIFSKAYSEKILKFIQKFQGNTVFDLCDNHFIKSTEHQALLIDICKCVDMVTTSTKALANIIYGYSEITANVVVDTLDYWVVQEKLNITIDELIKNIKNKSKKTSSKRSLWFGNSRVTYSDFGGVCDIHIFKKYLQSKHINIVSNNFIRSLKLLRHGIFPHYSKFSVEMLKVVANNSRNIIIPIKENEFTVIKSENRLLTSVVLGKDIIYTAIPSYSFLTGVSTFLDNNVYTFKQADVSDSTLKRILEPFLIDSVGMNWKALIKATNNKRVL